MFTKIVTNQYLYYSAIMVLAIYMSVDLHVASTSLSEKLPQNIKELYKNNLFKIIILSIVLMKSTNNLLNAVCLSVAFIFGAECILNSKEKFQIDTTDGGFKLSGVRQTSKTGQSKILTISQSSDNSLLVSSI
jgi:hypothetical protein